MSSSLCRQSFLFFKKKKERRDQNTENNFSSVVHLEWRTRSFGLMSPFAAAVWPRDEEDDNDVVGC